MPEGTHNIHIHTFITRMNDTAIPVVPEDQRKILNHAAWEQLPVLKSFQSLKASPF